MKIILSGRNEWHRFWNWRRCPPIRKFFDKGFFIGPFLVLTCPHKNLRCIHGDEILQTMTGWFGRHKGKIARVRCTDCGRPLYGRPRLSRCSMPGYTHY